MNTETSKFVATEILRQLGGDRAIVMMGAKGLAYGSGVDHNGYLRWQLGSGIRNSKNQKVTHIVVTLMLDDTYCVESYVIRGSTCKLLDKVEHVHADSLRGVVESVTGCYLSL